MKRFYNIIFVVTILLVITLSNFCVQAKDIDGRTMPIIGGNSAELSQMEIWAKNAKATPTFIGLAKLYWNMSKDHGGIDPVVAYAQAAKETNYGKFGGVIDASYYNVCGLKTTKGGGDYNPKVHQKFNSWEEGVGAHLDHLALYAGAESYPRRITKDSRHFSYIFGKVGNSVKNLGGKWAPSSNYGNEIISMVKSIKNTIPEKVLKDKTEIAYTNEKITYGNNKIYNWASSWLSKKFF